MQSKRVFQVSSWRLSPRWKIKAAPEPSLIGPDGAAAPLSPAQCDALRDGSFRYSPWVESDDLIPMLEWMRKLIAARALVPSDLVDPSVTGLSAEGFFLQVFQAVCHRLDADALWPRVRDGIAAWSGTVLRQPFAMPREYLPSRPALCLDLVGGTAGSVRIALDCRDPLLTPWENVCLARDAFRRGLRHGRELFERICGSMLADPSRFTSPYVKYLHPAIDYCPRGETVSAYWNLGRAADRNQRWERALQVLAALDLPSERLKRWRDRFGTVAQTELLGCNFNDQPPLLKVYAMFDGFDRRRLQEALALEHFEKAGQPVLQALERLLCHGVDPSQNVGIVSLYHAPDGSAQGGIKVHINLRDGFPARLTMEEVGAIVSEGLGQPLASLRSLPDTLTLESGKRITLVPHTLSYRLCPDRGLGRVTLYVNFVPLEDERSSGCAFH